MDRKLSGNLDRMRNLIIALNLPEDLYDYYWTLLDSLDSAGFSTWTQGQNIDMPCIMLW